ncbi:MAG: hypothetical protein AAF512_17950 [Pseudomonadota bacterium]
MNVGQTLSALRKPRLDVSGLKDLGARLPLDDERFEVVREFITLPAIPAVAEHVLVVYEQQLVLSIKGTHHIIASAQDEAVELEVYDAEHLAEAAKRLLPAADEDASICLCLPAYEFVSTHLNLPGVGHQSLDILENAVRLQQPALLPGFSKDLLLAVQPSRWVNPDGDYVALWLPGERSESLHRAFAAQALNLVMITPRPLAALSNGGAEENAIFDEDEETLTYVHWSGGAIHEWLHIAKEDYIADETFQGEFNTGNFRAQFHDMIEASGGGAPEIHQATFEDWLHAPEPSADM